MSSIMKEIFKIRIVMFEIALCVFLSPVCVGSAHANDDDFYLLTVAATSFRVKSTAIIGSAGGRIRAGSASVEFPAAAVPDETVVQLERTFPGDDFSDANDAAYVLDMATTHIAQDIALTLGVPGETDGTGFLAVQSEVTRSNGTTESLPPVVVSGVVQGQRLAAVLPALEAELRTLDAGPRLASPRVAYKVWHLRSTGVSYGSTARFFVTCPTRVAVMEPGIINRILEYAERAYTLLTGMGFAFDPQVNWPLHISVSYNLKPGVNGETVLPLSGKANQSITLSRQVCKNSDLNTLRATIGHEFFHVVQHQYDPRSAVKIRNTEVFTPYFFMLAEASSAWFEARMIGSATYVSPVFQLNDFRHAYGLEAWTSATDGQEAGYWGSGFIRYLRDIKGSDGFLSELWQAVRAQGTDGRYSDLRALFDCFGNRSVLAGHWHDFMRKWNTATTGYAGWRLPPSDQAWYFNVSGPSGQIVQGTQPFSGRKWRFNFGSLGTSKDYFFNIISDSNFLTYTLYKETILSPSTSTFQKIADLNHNAPHRRMVDDGDVYAVVVSNNGTNLFKTTTQAGLRVGQVGTNSMFCRDVPNDAVFQSGNLYYQWRHATGGYLVADETYFDAQKKNISHASCFWYVSGNKQFYGTWYSNNNKRSEIKYDEDGLAHEEDKKYYDTGILKEVYTWDHGHQTGPFFQYYQNGQTYCAGGFDDGLEHGEWSYYDDGGGWLYTCTYSYGAIVNCVYP